MSELTEEKRKENLQNLIDFFKDDVDSKKILSEIAPSEMDLYDTDSIIKYMDKRDESVKDIEFYINDMVSKFTQNSFMEKIISEKLESLRKSVIESSTTAKGCKECYQKNFSDMSPELIEDIKKCCKGHYIRRPMETAQVLEKASTYNEIIHIIHSYVSNNEEIFETMPIVAKKEINQYNDFTVYGEETKVAKSIYDAFEVDKIDTDSVQVVSFGDKTIVMMRGLGHAVSMEIDTSGEKAKVNYFIPKVINKKMVSKLNGINTISMLDEKSIKGTATGVFEIENIDNIGQEIIDFAGKIPTDFDKEEIKTEEFQEKEENLKSEEVWEERLVKMEEDSLSKEMVVKKKNIFSMLKNLLTRGKEKGER